MPRSGEAEFSQKITPHALENRDSPTPNDKYINYKNIMNFPIRPTWRHYEQIMLTQWNTIATQHSP